MTKVPPLPNSEDQGTISTKAADSGFWKTAKRLGLHFCTSFLVVMFLGVCLVVISVLGGTAWQLWEAIGAAVGSTRPGRFFAFIFLALITAGCFATFGGFLCFSTVKDFLRQNTTFSSKQKDSIESNAFMVGALIPAGFYLFICFKGWLEGKI
jgi:hypothetical protein